MRKAVMPFVVSVGLIAVWAAPADAASTRAEYVAQVDPICVAAVGAETNALGAVSRNSKRWGHAAKARNVKAFIRTTRRLAGSVNAFARVHASVTDQIAAVAPPADDAGTVGTWLNNRRQAGASYRSAASALNLFKVRKFFSLLRQGDAAEVAGMRAISGLGFQTCGVSV
jgi:hypothetical protein